MCPTLPYMKDSVDKRGTYIFTKTRAEGSKCLFFLLQRHISSNDISAGRIRFTLSANNIVFSLFFSDFFSSLNQFFIYGIVQRRIFFVSCVKWKINGWKKFYRTLSYKVIAQSEVINNSILESSIKQ